MVWRLQSQVCRDSNFSNAFDLRVKNDKLWVTSSTANGGFCSKVGNSVLYFPLLLLFATIIARFLS